MTTPEKCEAILRRILTLANDGKPVRFSEDWGDYSLTLEIGEAHTHVGLTEEQGGSFDNLVDGLLNSLTGGPGLSFAKGATQ